MVTGGVAPNADGRVAITAPSNLSEENEVADHRTVAEAVHEPDRQDLSSDLAHRPLWVSRNTGRSITLAGPYQSF